MADIAGTYTLVKIELGASGVFEDVTSSNLDDCEKDDKLVLNANGTTSYEDLGVVCSPSGNDTGTWSIDNNGKITISDNGSSTDVSSADITLFRLYHFSTNDY